MDLGMVTEFQNHLPLLYFTNNADFSWPELVNKFVSGPTSSSASANYYEFVLVLCRETGTLKNVITLSLSLTNILCLTNEMCRNW